MVTLTTVTYLAEADRLRTQLEAYGIDAYLPDEGALSANPFISNAIGGLRVQVHENDLERARDILRSTPPRTTRGMFSCPKCSSDDVQFERLSKRLAFATILLLGIPLFWYKRVCICRTCGHKWKRP